MYPIEFSYVKFVENYIFVDKKLLFLTIIYWKKYRNIDIILCYYKVLATSNKFLNFFSTSTINYVLITPQLKLLGSST